MKLLSIQVGGPQDFTYKGQTVTTSIFKSPLKGSVRVREFNIDGDRQSDLTVHGGRDKAVYAYSFDAFDWWKKTRPELTFEYGAFGENLTLDKLDEEKTYIGDSFKIGEAILQVTQPRQPCFKLGIRFNDSSILKTFMLSKRPGVYYRVLKEGLIQAGDQLELIDRETTKVSVSELFGLMTSAALEKSRLQEILQVKALPDYWRFKVQSIL